MTNEEFLDSLIRDDVVDYIHNNLNEYIEYLPEIKTIINFNQKHPHHNLDVFEHSLYAISLSPKNKIIRCALFFHDIGKPECAYEGTDGYLHFHGHNIESYEITKDIFKRLNWTYETDLILDLIKNHDCPMVNKKVFIKRYINEWGYNNLNLLLEVKYADARAHHPDHIKSRISELDSLMKNIKLYNR